MASCGGADSGATDCVTTDFFAVGALAASSYALRELISALGLPAIEVHLKDPLQEPWKRSVIADACSGQVAGKGPDGYLLALERLARVDRLARESPPKSAGRKPPALKLARSGPPSATPPPRAKSVGRIAPSSKKGKAVKLHDGYHSTED